jgi:hypothetical protein
MFVFDMVRWLKFECHKKNLLVHALIYFLDEETSHQVKW